MQLRAILVNVHKLLNQSLCPHQSVSIHCVHEEKPSKTDCNKVFKKIKSLFQIMVSRSLCLAAASKNANKLAVQRSLFSLTGSGQIYHIGSGLEKILIQSIINPLDLRDFLLF